METAKFDSKTLFTKKDTSKERAALLEQLVEDQPLDNEEWLEKYKQLNKIK